MQQCLLRYKTWNFKKVLWDHRSPHSDAGLRRQHRTDQAWGEGAAGWICWVTQGNESFRSIQFPWNDENHVFTLLPVLYCCENRTPPCTKSYSKIYWWKWKFYSILENIDTNRSLFYIQINHWCSCFCLLHFYHIPE